MKLKPYWPFAVSTIQVALSYGANFFVFVFGGFVRVFLMFFLWQAIFLSGGQETLNGFTFPQMVVYLFGVELVLRLVFASDTDWLVGMEIRDGSIAMQLIKPISYTGRLFAQGLGGLFFESLFVVTPLVLVFSGLGFAFVPGLALPGPAEWAAFALCILLAYILVFFFNLSFGFLAFYLKNLWGLGNFKYNVINILSGALIPLAFFPEAVQPVLKALPFSSLVHIPISALLGKLTGLELWQAWGMQLVWILVFWGLSRFIYAGAVRRLTVQGG